MADRYYVNGGVDDLWGSTSNWSTTSGGAGGSSVPTSSDDVFFDASSGHNCTVGSSARTCRNFNGTGYTGTITLNTNLTISPANLQTMIFGAGMAFAAGGGTLNLAPGNVNVTFTTNGITIPTPVDIGSNSGVITLSDDFNVSGLLRFTGSNTTKNGNNIFASAGFTMVGGNHGGTTVLHATGTGTWSRSGGALRNPLTINTAGTITFSGTFVYGALPASVLTYTAGTVVTTGSTLDISVEATLNCAGITWNNLTWNTASSTLWLSANVNIGGNFAIGVSGTVDLNGAFTVNVGGHYTCTGGGTVRGISSAAIALVGSGTWSQASGVTTRPNTTINTSGTITFSGNINYNTGTLTYTAGTLAGASTPAFVVTATTTFNLGGVVMPAGLTMTTAGVTLNFSSGVEWDDTVALTLIGTAGSPVVIKSSSAGVQRTFTVQPGTSIDIGYCNITDLDNSAGAKVHVFKGTISNSLNFSHFTPYDAPFGGSGGGGGGGSFAFVG